MPQDFQHQIFDFLMQSQYFEQDQLLAQQMHQLEQLLRFTRREVPFYQKRLASLFDSQDQFLPNHWHDVPILKRQDLLAHGGQMFADQLPAGHGPTADHEGSGTTGTTVTTRHNALTGQASQAAYYRAMAWHHYDYSKIFFSWGGSEPGQNRGPSGSDLGAWGPNWLDPTRRGKQIHLSRLDPASTALDLIQKLPAAYVCGDPAIVIELADSARKSDLRISLAGFTTFGSGVTPEIRELGREVFGAGILDRYASKEVYDIAYQCPITNNLHINSELMLVEVLDDDNKQCAPGQSGRIVVTSFYNTVQPIIRYELGDLVTLAEPCACGRSLPAISSLDGRTRHLFKLPGGKRLALRLPHQLKKSIQASEWQVAQVGLEAIEVRYIKKADAPPEAFMRLEELFRSQMTPKTTVTFLPTKKLPQTPSGKVLEMVCEVDPQDTGS